ncbi:MAG: hypothetical protein O2955_12770 [Planctomycetota bacterium]|nr:hypothetical protein [Planctomycetota bacterium]MDA1213381.1 hypothetical protein [Planctomycetota bacterium]
MKRTIPVLIASIAGLVLIIAHFVPPAQSWGDEVNTWFQILAAFAFFLGGGSLLKMHLKRISDQQEGWGFSAVTLLAFGITLIVGIFKLGVLPSETYPTKPWSGEYLGDGGALWWIYQYLFTPLNATMFALLAFFISSAAFRAFRAKNTEAMILLVTATIVLVGRTYAGAFLTEGFNPHWQLAAIIDEWFMSVFNTAGARAIKIGIALGVVSTSLKVLIGTDRSYLGSEE